MIDLLTSDFWIWAGVAAGAIATFFAQRAWPFLTKEWAEDAKARRQIQIHAAEAQEQRFIAAIESSAVAQRETAEALGKIGQALDLFARSSTTMTFQVDELRRDLDRALGDIRLWVNMPARRSSDRLVPIHDPPTNT